MKHCLVNEDSRGPVPYKELVHVVVEGKNFKSFSGLAFDYFCEEGKENLLLQTPEYLLGWIELLLANLWKEFEQLTECSLKWKVNKCAFYLNRFIDISNNKVSTESLPEEVHNLQSGGKRSRPDGPLRSDTEEPATSSQNSGSLPKIPKINEFRFEEMADGCMKLKSSNTKIDYLEQRELEVKFKLYIYSITW